LQQIEERLVDLNRTAIVEVSGKRCEVRTAVDGVKKLEVATNCQGKAGALVIREATANDSERIGELALQLIRLEHSLNAGTGEPTPWAGSAAEIRKQMARTTTKFLIAERNGELVGYTRVDLHGVDRRQGLLWRMLRWVVESLTRRPRANYFSSGGVISGILVTETERRTGVGNLLVEAAAKWLYNRGVSRVYVHVLRNNQSALQFWQKNGFETVTLVLSRRLDRTE